MKFIIDRIENDLAVIELDNEEIITIPKKILKSGCQDGDIYEIKFLKDETIKRRKKMKKMLDSIFDK